VVAVLDELHKVSYILDIVNTRQVFRTRFTDCPIVNLWY